MKGHVGICALVAAVLSAAVPAWANARQDGGAAGLSLAPGEVATGIRREIVGQVVSVDPDALRVTLRVGEGDAAVEQAFAASPGDLALAVPGTRVRAEAFPYFGGQRVEAVWPFDPVAERLLAEVNRRLREDTVARGARAFRTVGEYLPDFALRDHDGKVVQARDFRGKRLVMNFIFTRCQDAHMCPAATTRMARLQEELKALGVADVLLVSISFDPRHDTPGVLRQYATDRGIDLATYRFLTGPERAIQDVVKQAGIVAYAADGTIRHTMATLVVGADGQILWRKDGTRWTVPEVLGRLQR